jgi:hypothetical protein
MRGTYITLNDQLVFQVVNSNPDLTSLSAVARILQPDGTILMEIITINNLPADRSAAQNTLPLSEGMLVGLLVGFGSTQSARGQTFVNVWLQRGGGLSQAFNEMLIADYFTRFFQPSWPAGSLKSSTDGRGYITSYTGAVPPTGDPPVITIPPTVRWRLLGGSFTVETSADPGTRNPGLSIIDGLNTIYQMTWPQTLGPSQEGSCSFGPSVPYSAAGVYQETGPIPEDMFLAGGISIAMAGGLVATDVASALTVAVEEWIDV